jgi:2-keto-4-pentenoate hydratase/2-oxohepta-3-ene-1,7-dioic acid hydratase in catechol pathway
MQLVRLGPPDSEIPAVIIDETHYVDVSAVAQDFDARFFANDGITRLVAALPGLITNPGPRPIGDLRFGAPIARPHQILCIGLNYRDHAAETGQDIPEEPILFTKAPNTLIGPNDDVQIPRGSVKTDYEVELGVVIGRRAHCLQDLEDAVAAIAGYTLVNDVSERAFQLERGGQWPKGKSCPTFNPCGPWLATADEIADPQNLDMQLHVNGKPRQASNTSAMIFTAAHLVHYLSQFLALEPGDLINTGTPAGVAMSMTPPAYLRDGDIVELTITGLGTQRQLLVAARPV